MVRCASCQQENPDGARFCNSCGAPLPQTAAQERQERRIVTVLFADMAGFTARAERLDPEEVRAILSRYYERLREEIEAFGGVVEKFIGDAVVAIFGAPVAHGDDPERAVRAAFAVRDAVDDMNAADPELNLEVRVAVNTGEAIVAVNRAALREGMVAGDVINTASRMQSAAPANGILVGEATYRATRGIVDYREVEPLAVKGKQAPVAAWLAQQARSAPGERHVSSVPMLGRGNELTALNRIFENVVRDNRPHLVTVFGEAGIGKTRLCSEFLEPYSGNAVRILRGRSLPYGENTVYGTFSQHVKQFANIFASDEVAAAEAKLRAALGTVIQSSDIDQIATHLELLIGLGSGEEVAQRQTLFLAARRFVESLATQRPTVLVFEDLHWAGAGILDLVEVLASRVRDVPVMLLALARPELLHDRPAWGGGLSAYTALSLAPLSLQEASDLAARLVDQSGADHDGLRLVETAEGNPLFIEELVAAASERAAAADGELPTTIRELVSARLDCLPARERDVLLDAAVVGKVFWKGALEQMTDQPAALLEALDSLEARDLIRREPLSWIETDEQFSFKHVLIRDVAYATVPRSRRKSLHAVVARFLEQATSGAGSTATALARHWREAGEDARALEYLLVAAEQAGRGWAKTEAATLYGEALELCPEPDSRRAIVRKQAMALAAAQHLPDARHQISADARELNPQ